jgi:hypothetical protein
MQPRMHLLAKSSVWFVLTLACAATTPLTKEPSSPASPESPATHTVTMTLTLPPALPSTGVLTTAQFSAAEVEAKAHEDVKQFYRWLERIRRAEDIDSDPRTVTIALEAPEQPSFVQVRFDVGGNGLDALLGTLPTVAQALVPLTPGVAAVTADLTAPAPRPTREACAGPRLEKIVLEAPDLRRPGDDGTHSLCVFLPADYLQQPTRRYPVAFALPGFSGLAAQNDGFGARGLFDTVGAEVGIAAIVVGVETRIPEGTSYLARSPRTGDWESYFVKRVLPEIDRRYRTEPRRAVYGHSTGGWNAVSIGLRYPDAFVAVAASSPDPLDLDTWLFDASGTVLPKWRAWALAEQALDGRGQFKSWAVSWSPGADGADELIDGNGVRLVVLERWRSVSPFRFVSTSPGQDAARRLSGRMFVTAGKADMFDLFRPSERFVQALQAQKVNVTWVPTELDHFGASNERFRPLVRFVLERLAPTSN